MAKVNSLLHIALTGYMGSGKTRLGKALAKDMGMDFIDLDYFIEQKEALSVDSIFKEKGEIYFRALETDCIREILALNTTGIVLSLGGGAMQNDINAALLFKNTFLVYLKFNPKVLRGRLENSKTKRPIIAGMRGDELEGFIAAHLAEREANYNKAHFTLDNVMDINTRCELIGDAFRHFK
jgi:shikimate kinase